MTVIQEFKKFALRGNMIDLAVGFTVGAAFTTVVKSLVNDLLMPPIGLLTGNADFADHFLVLKIPDRVEVPEGGFQTLSSAQQAGAVTLNYGVFINSCLALAIVAMAMFLVVRAINRIDAELDRAFDDSPAADDEPSDKKCNFCRTTIPFRAVRCPHCTSQLPPAEETEAGPATT